MKELKSRLLWGGVGLAILVVVLWLFPQPWFQPIVGLGVAFVASVGLYEFYCLARANGFVPSVYSGIALGIFYLAVRYFDPYYSLPALLLVAFLFFVRHLRVRAHALASLTISVFGILYVTFPLGLIFDILYRFPDGRWWFIFLLAVTVATDMGAYFVGQLIGRTPLAPHLSPNKTLEGAVGGIVVGVLVAWILSMWGVLALWPTLILGFALTIVGQVGDLAESLFKRDADVKDSSNLPGLGGVLDVVDSLLFNLPLIYLVEAFL